MSFLARPIFFSKITPDLDFLFRIELLEFSKFIQISKSEMPFFQNFFNFKLWDL